MGHIYKWYDIVLVGLKLTILILVAVAYMKWECPKSSS